MSYVRQTTSPELAANTTDVIIVEAAAVGKLKSCSQTNTIKTAQVTNEKRRGSHTDLTYGLHIGKVIE